ncbi:hypothetical protein SODALDRAFT_318698 [Sodiomyces alkalinus F11]|uniref:Uncharacterized protein n=1 Tax=Sodiomyces alkalinus (strain CBS 110278 / VKM F-3762 / F11) TaxID=1314773 RepID=A0A3N2Q5C0_SODAK|nr:hypothetical protein SODALDRAFT_318698 [Sodiomyces alkalinus F11]ROT41896.1 hypothetical protein SODALDRAFT_318698 [Sodiomyces alkalinus F11]
MQLDHSFRNIYSRVYRIMGKEKKQDTKRIEISAPFNFQHVNATLAGISPEQVSVLREQAAASRIGIADPDPTELGYAHDEGFDSDASSSYSPRYRSSSAAALARTSMLPELEDYAYYYNRRRATSVSSPRRYTRGPGSVSSTSSRRSTVSRQSGPGMTSKAQARREVEVVNPPHTATAK